MLYMEVGKLFASVTIAILLTLSVTNLLSTFYRPPTQSLSLFDLTSEDYSGKLTTYQNISYSIIASFSIAFLIIGFFLIKKESIGAGFIGGGVFLLTYGDALMSINMISSIFGTRLLSLGNGTDKIPLISYLNLFFTLAMLSLAITFSYFKLEKSDKANSSENN